MPKHRTELFGQFIYAPEISYDDLLELEQSIKDFVTSSLEENGAEFVAFESEGDRTFFQCVFQEFDESLFKNVCKPFVGKVNAQMECKLQFVDKMLMSSYFYGINHKNIIAEKFSLKPAGPIDEALITAG